MVSLYMVSLVSLLYLGADCNMPPVENVTVVCHNFQAVVYWNHSRPDLNPRFEVELRTSNIRNPPSPQVVCSDSSGYRCDVSEALRGSIEAEYSVYVTAAGQDESQPKWFSYGKDTIGQICSVDLPLVNISAQSGRMKLSFQHPFHFYRHSINQLEWKSLKREAFEFQIKHLNEEMLTEEVTCPTENHICNVEIQVKMTAGNHCVKIEGNMGTLNVISPNITCSPPPTEPGNYMWIYLVVLGVVLVVLLLCVLLTITRIWTTRSSPLPKSIASKLFPAMSGSLLRPEQTNTCVVDVSARLIPTPESTPCETPTSTTPSEQEEVLRLPIGLHLPDGLRPSISRPDAEQGEGDRPPSPHHRPAGSEYETHMGVSEYESRPRHFPVQVEMEPGDVVEGYRTSDLGGSG